MRPLVIASSEVLKKLSADFERLFENHYEFVHRTAYRVTGNFADAEDVIQTLFMRLCRQKLSAELLADPRRYLYTSALHIALDTIRTRRRHPAESDERAMLDIPSKAAPSPGEEELNDRLRAALAELPSKAAEILILRHVHGYTDVEIAKLLGTTRGTVAVSLFRSRARIRRSIRGSKGGEE
jgi:RNA polymerase sigma-70 factor, ECF subfamily